MNFSSTSQGVQTGTLLDSERNQSHNFITAFFDYPGAKLATSVVVLVLSIGFTVQYFEGSEEEISPESIKASVTSQETPAPKNTLPVVTPTSKKQEILLPKNGKDCPKGYNPSGDNTSCLLVELPKNAELVGKTNNWRFQCKKGYNLSKNLCVKVTVPKNATLTGKINNWTFTCNKGYTKSTDGKSCVAIPKETPPKGNSLLTPPASSGSGFSCSCSKTCPNMASCEEAYYQLEVCGCAKRDGDNDGVPCEEICK